MRLEARNIGFRYAKHAWVLREVQLSVDEGEVVGLSGPSGRGKSTLARLLAGYERAHEGEIRIGGQPLPTSGYHPVQLVLQHPEKAVNPRMTMRRILNEGWAPDRAFRESLGIAEEWLDRYPNELSGGELQRFCIARALGPSTRFLIADEMTTMLDAITQAQIWHAVLQIARERRLGMLVISHERKLLERLCSRIMEL